MVVLYYIPADDTFDFAPKSVSPFRRLHITNRLTYKNQKKVFVINTMCILYTFAKNSQLSVSFKRRSTASALACYLYEEILYCFTNAALEALYIYFA